MTREPVERARGLLDDPEQLDGFAVIASSGGRDVEVVLDAADGEAGFVTQLSLIGVYLEAFAATLGDDVEAEDVARDAVAMLDDRSFVGIQREGGTDR